MSCRKKAIAVCGGSEAGDKLLADAFEVGRRIVEAGCVLVCGGRGGVMEAAARGGQEAKSEGASGLVVGILLSDGLESGNEYLDVAIPTGMGVGRNIFVVRAADAVILLGGGAGTLSEAAHAWQLNKPIVALVGSGGIAESLAGKSIDLRRSDAIVKAHSPEEAVAIALRFANVVSPG
ncbi:MAG: TIGR00725 family protein [Pseudomonadota bacterium]